MTCELLDHRERVKKSYAVLEPFVSQWVRKNSEEFLEDRLLLNISSVLTVFLIVAAPQVECDGDEDAQFEALCAAGRSTYLVDFGFSFQRASPGPDEEREDTNRYPAYNG